MDVHDGSSSTPLEIHLLGRFLIYVYGRALPETAIKGRKARSLLKLISIQSHYRIVRDRAMSTFWPELEESAAASQLYKALHHIRKALSTESEEADEWIEITDDLIRLVPPGGVVTDVHQFEEAARSGLREQSIQDLESAVSIYAGDLLPMDRYTDWASLPREHYRQLYLDVLTTLGTQYEQRGELSDAAQMLRLALEKDPALESAHRALMRIFARQGQPTRAFRQYDLCREVLHDELGVGPSSETKETLESVQERQFSEEGEPTPVQATTPAPMPPLINRSVECAEIDNLLDRLSSGEGSTLLLSGGMGLGKTRLIQELALRARRRNLRVFSAGTQEGRGAGAYGLFVELFNAVLHEEPQLEELLPAELGRLVPSFSGDGVSVPHADKLAAQGYLFAQVHRFLSGLAEEGPAVLILEDLHAADEGSRELFSYLVRHREEMPLLFAATTREKEAVPILESGPAVRKDEVTRLTLDPLTSDEHASLLKQHAAPSTVPEDAIQRIFQLSEGNPLFALELLQFRSEADDGIPSVDEGILEHGSLASTVEQVPGSLSYVVEERLEALSPEARQLLYISAVIGRHVSYQLMASVWSEAPASEEEIFEPLEELIRAGLLEEQGLAYSFRHALVHEVIYASISEARRQTLHTSIARGLVAMSADEEDEPVEQIAHHFVRGGEIRQGVHYLVRAGERAEEAYAHEEALQRYREALDALENLDDTRAQRLKRDVLERMGDEYRAFGQIEESYDAYEKAVRLAEEVPLTEQNQVELHRKIAHAAIFATEMEHSERHLTTAFDLVGDDARARARLLITKALHSWHLNQLEKAYELAQEALELVEAVDPSTEVSQAYEILAMICLPLGRWEEGLEYERQRYLEGWSPEIVVATDAHLCLWEYYVTGDRPFQQARSFMEEVAEQAEEFGDLRCVAICHYALGTMHLWRGEHEKAIEELEASMDLHDRVGSPAGKAYALTREGVLHTMNGAMERGWQAVQNGIENAKQASLRDHCLQRLYGIGIWNRLEAEDRSTAQALVEKSRQLLDDMGACANCALELYPWLAYFYFDSGEVARARTCGEKASTLASKTGNPVGKAAAAMIESSLFVTEQEEDRAQRRRREAFDLAAEAVREDANSPLIHYLDQMVDQQAELRAA